MSDGRTHYEGCWREHHDCAVARIEWVLQEIGDHLKTAGRGNAAPSGAESTERAPAVPGMPEEPRSLAWRLESNEILRYIKQLRDFGLEQQKLCEQYHERLGDACGREMKERVRAEAAERELEEQIKLAQGYYNEASEGWTKFRAAERLLRESLQYLDDGALVQEIKAALAERKP